MKTNLRFLKWLMMLLILAGTLGVTAQPYPNQGAQTVCITGIADPYGVINTSGSTYAWTVIGGATPADWVLTSTGTNLATVLWKTAGTYTIQVVETNSIGCANPTPVTVLVTVNPQPLPPTSGGDITQCEQSPIQTLTATATAPSGSTVVWYTAATGGTVVVNPILNTVGTITYYAESQATLAPNCPSSSRTAVTLTISPAPAAPTSGGDITQCEQSPIQTLTATATAPSGSSVVWYTAATGGTVVVNPILNTVGTVTYYAESVVTVGGCTSLTRTAVTLTISPAPAAPTSGGDITQCEQSPIQTLTATATAPAGSSVVWYTAATGGTVVVNPILNTVGTVTYYAESVVTVGGCTSLTRTAVTLTISPAPAAPTSGGDITQCEQSPIQTLTATATAPAGSSVVWYTAATGGTVVVNPILNTVGTVTYYAESVVTVGGCTSLTRTAVTLTISPAPAAPTSGGDITQCEQSPIQTLTATATAPSGSSVVWYTAATGGTVVVNPILNTVGTITYYAESVITVGGCTSLTRTAVTLTISPAPVAPTSGGDITQCEQSPIQTLTATATAPAGSSVVWYTAATGGTVVVNPILNTVGTVTYYAESVVTVGGCTSLTRTAVTLTISPAPVAPTSGGDITQCEQSPIQTLTATATAPSGSSVVWYTAATGGTVVVNPILNTVGTITYYAESVVTVGGCTSLTRTAVTLTISPAPVAPTSGGDITQCEQSPIQTLTATATAPAGSSVVWYTAATGGTVVVNPILNTVGTVTYYAESVVTVGGCTSLTRTAVTLTISPAPAAPTSGGDITECQQSPIQTLTAVATSPSGSTIVWYTAATGGTVVVNPILNTVGTITYYAESVVTVGGCTSLTRTAVTLTIQLAPTTSPIYHN